MTITLVYYVFIKSIVVTHVCAQYCYMDDTNPYLYFGSNTAYGPVGANQIKNHSECEPSYIWALIRHGTRFMSKPGSYPIDILDYTKEKITILRNQIVTNNKIEKRGRLCSKDLQSLEKWTYKWDEDMDGELTPQGKRDMASLSARFGAQFEGIFSAPMENFRFHTTSFDHVNDSAHAFVDELFKNRTMDQNEISITVNDKLLWIQNEEDSDNDEYEKFINSNYVKKVISDVSFRLGFEELLTFEDVKMLYEFCVAESVWEPEFKATFCVPFTREQLKILDYAEDLKHYYTLGYGDKMNSKLATPLARDLFTRLDAAAKNNISQAASVYFSRVETFLPFITKLGLFYDEVPLKHDNYEAMKETHKWKTALIDPFAANIIVILYSCATDHKVMFYSNEQLIHYPTCQHGVCTLEVLKRKFEDEFNVDGDTSDSRATYSYLSIYNIFSAASLIFFVAFKATS